MLPRRNWDSPNPSLASECVPLPGTKGGGEAHSPGGEGLGESQFRRLEKSLALCLLCGPESSRIRIGGEKTVHHEVRMRGIDGNGKLWMDGTIL